MIIRHVVVCLHQTEAEKSRKTREMHASLRFIVYSLSRMSPEALNVSFCPDTELTFCKFALKAYLEQLVKRHIFSLRIDNLFSPSSLCSVFTLRGLFKPRLCSSCLEIQALKSEFSYMPRYVHLICSVDIKPFWTKARTLCNCIS